MKKLCPLIKKECLGHGCEWYVHMVGTHPQTGVTQDEFGCAISWLPLLQVEIASRVRQAAASTDKVANQVAKQHATIIGLSSPEAQARLLNADPRMQLTNGKNEENKNGPES